MEGERRVWLPCRTSRLCHRAAGYEGALIVCTPVQEPPKAAMLEYEASGREGPKPARQAACIVQLPAEPGAAVVEALVDLSSPTPAIITWDRVSSAYVSHGVLHMLCQAGRITPQACALSMQGTGLPMRCAVLLLATCMCQELLPKIALAARLKACSPW